MRRYRKDARVAQIYEREIVPLWTERFGRLLLREVQLPSVPRPRATVLDVFCGTGWASLSLLARVGDGVRVVAVDSSPVLLDVARAKAGPAAGRRVFFRSEVAEPRLPFDSEVFDLVMSNLGLWDVAEPRQLLHEMVRVAKPGARVAATLPLIGTFAEIYELFGQVLAARGMAEAERRLRAHITRMPSALEAKSWLVEAGLQDVRVECEPFTLLFAGGREFFFSPLIEYGPLPDWKDVVGQGPALQEVFWQLKDALDASIGGPAEAPGGSTPAFRPFSLTVRAGCLSGRKPADWAADVPVRPQPPRPAPAASPRPAPAEESAEEGVVELHTGEIDILSMMPKEDPRKGR